MSPLRRSRAVAILEESLRRRNFAPSTIALTRRFLSAFFRSIEKSWARVTREDVRRYLAARARSVSRNTTARDLEVIRGFYQCLTDAGHLERDPTDGLSIARGPARPPLLLSEETVKRLLAGALVLPELKRSRAIRRAVALRNRAALELLYGAGLRASEVHAVRVLDLALPQGEVLCRRAKGGVSRYLPLPEASVPWLAKYLREGRPELVRPDGRDRGFFLVTERGTPFPPNEILRTVSLLAKRLGLRAHPHALRRALATHLVRDGASLAAVRELLGHVRLSTTERYVSVSREDLRRAVSLLEGSGALRSREALCSHEPEAGAEET